MRAKVKNTVQRTPNTKNCCPKSCSSQRRKQQSPARLHFPCNGRCTVTAHPLLSSQPALTSQHSTAQHTGKAALGEEPHCPSLSTANIGSTGKGESTTESRVRDRSWPGVCDCVQWALTSSSTHVVKLVNKPGERQNCSFVATLLYIFNYEGR